MTLRSSGSAVSLGVDFGTESGRVLVLDLATGAELGVAEVRYARGVIEDVLPGSGVPLGLDWALQDPSDYIEVIERGIPAALSSARIDPRRVVGLGVDVTSCTVLPTLSDGTPLSALERWRDHPHAWNKLWKHHAAQAYADRLTEVALERGEELLQRYGGRISSEWYFPKLLQMFCEDRDVYDAADAFVEATDWITWQLTGSLVRSSCAAGYKAFWSEETGLPPTSFFTAAYGDFVAPGEKLGTSFSPLGTRAGYLREDLAGRLGLGTRVAVSVGNVDSFVSVPGAGVERAGTFVMVVGTSICDMVVHEKEVRLPGVTGVVRDGILPGSYGYEAGQPAVGDMLAWYVDQLLDTGPHQRSAVYAALESAASGLRPGATGLVALDWWNGNRSVLADADLSGAIVGLTLATTPAEIYRALLESIAFGTRRIVDNFDDHGLGIEHIVACGGVAEKSPTLMQLVADVTERTVDVPASPQIPARGAALFGAVAAGAAAGGFDQVSEAVAALRPATRCSYAPDDAAAAVYRQVYGVYRGVHDVLGRDQVGWMHDLKAIRWRILGASGPASSAGTASPASSAGTASVDGAR